MLLGKYFHNINKNYRNFSFSGISFNTKSVKKNNIFFAIKGNSIDGNKFIPKAIKKGSKIIVTERKTNPFQNGILFIHTNSCLLYTSPSPRDAHESRMPSSA